MISIMNSFINELNNNNLYFKGRRINELFQEIKYFISPDLNNIKQNFELMNFIHKNKFFAIDSFNELEGDKETRYFILSFSNLYVFIIDYSSIPVIEYLLSSCVNPNIIFLGESKTDFDKLIHGTQYNEIKLKPFLKMRSILDQFYVNPKYYNFVKIIMPSIFISCFQFDRKISKSYEPSNQETISEKDYVSLQEIGIGSINFCELVFHFKLKKFLALKKPNLYDSKNERLYNREIQNYSFLRHPLFPRFYGTSDSKCLGIFIEYICGKPLYDRMFGNIYTSFFNINDNYF